MGRLTAVNPSHALATGSSSTSWSAVACATSSSPRVALGARWRMPCTPPSAPVALRLHVRVDERTAGFLALGLAKGSGLPVAVDHDLRHGGRQPAPRRARGPPRRRAARRPHRRPAARAAGDRRQPDDDPAGDLRRPRSAGPPTSRPRCRPGPRPVLAQHGLPRPRRARPAGSGGAAAQGPVHLNVCLPRAPDPRRCDAHSVGGGVTVTPRRTGPTRSRAGPTGSRGCAAGDRRLATRRRAAERGRRGRSSSSATSRSRPRSRRACCRLGRRARPPRRRRAVRRRRRRAEAVPHGPAPAHRHGLARRPPPGPGRRGRPRRPCPGRSAPSCAGPACASRWCPRAASGPTPSHVASAVHPPSRPPPRRPHDAR